MYKSYYRCSIPWVSTKILEIEIDAGTALNIYDTLL